MGERIVIASDHAAVEMKAMLVAHLEAAGHEVVDLGPGGVDSVDYPDYGYKIAEAVAAGRADRGIALCGTGVGISISVNRHPACRCAIVSEPVTARLAREHNDANVIALGARLIGPEMAKACVDAFLSTPLRRRPPPAPRRQAFPSAFRQGTRMSSSADEITHASRAGNSPGPGWATSSPKASSPTRCAGPTARWPTRSPPSSTASRTRSS